MAQKLKKINFFEPKLESNLDFVMSQKLAIFPTVHGGTSFVVTNMSGLAFMKTFCFWLIFFSALV